MVEYITQVVKNIISDFKNSANFGDPAVDADPPIKVYYEEVPQAFPQNYPLIWVSYNAGRTLAIGRDQAEFAGGVTFFYIHPFDIAIMHSDADFVKAAQFVYDKLIQAETVLRADKDLKGVVAKGGSGTAQVDTFPLAWNHIMARAQVAETNYGVTLGILKGRWIKGVAAF